MALLGDQLRGWWTFADGAELEPTFGGDTLQNNGSVTFNSGVAAFTGGGSLDLPFAAASAAGVVTGDFDWTWAIRFRVAALPAVTPTILCGQGDIGSSDLGVVVTLRTDGTIFFQITPDGSTTAGNRLEHTSTVSLNTWTTCIFRYDDATGTIWGTIQTTHESQAEAIVHESSGDIQIGDQVGLSSDPFTGDMAWVGFWDRFLSNDECFALDNFGNGREPDAQGVFALTEIESIVDPGGNGDYLDLQEWNDDEIAAATQINMIQLNATHTALCSVGDVGPLAMSGDWVSDDDRFVRVKAAPAAKHAGKFATTGVALIDARGSGVHAFTLSALQLRVEDMVVWQDQSGATSFLLQFASTAVPGGVVRLDNVVAKGGGQLTNVVSGRSPLIILRDVIAHGYAKGVTINFGNGELWNNAIVTDDDCIATAGSVVIDEQNNYFHRTTGSVYDDGAGGTINKGANSQTSNTEALTPANRGIAYSTANFLNVTLDSEDLHLPEGSALIDQGADLSSEGVLTDIDGVTRPQGSAYDVGAVELVQSTEPEILEVQLVTLSGLDPVFTPAHFGCHHVANDGRTWLALRNNSGSSRTVTIDSLGECDQGFDHDVSVEVPAGETVLVGTFEVKRFTGLLEVCYSSTIDLEVAALRIELDDC